LADYESFVHGAVTLPLPAQGLGLGSAGATLLRDADPAIYYLLEFYAAVITKHVGPRLLSEAAACGADDIEVAVAESIPLNPEVFLTEEHIRFPMLCASRTGTKYMYVGQRKQAVDTIEVSYVLPALTGGLAERLVPILYAVAACLDNRTERGMDPAYAEGARVWEIAGVARAEITSASYGGYAPTDRLYFPAVKLVVELRQNSDVATGDFELFQTAHVHVDVPETATTEEYLDAVEFLAPPTSDGTLSATTASAGLSSTGTVT